MKIYTAGGMEFVSEKDMLGWREEVEEQCSAAGIECLHPTRRKPLHDQLEDTLPSYNKLKRITTQDLIDIKSCDLILADLRDSSPGRKWGTCMEVALASEWNIPVIVIVDEDQFKHPFIYTFATEVHYTLQDAIDAVIDYTN